MKCVEIERNTGGESVLLAYSDTKRRKLGEQAGLDTPVVLAVNDGYYVLFFRNNIQANALSIPPGKYARKSETQRNWREPAQAVEHVV